MSGKFGIAFVTACALFVQAVLFNTSSADSPAAVSVGQSPNVSNNIVTSPCSVDQHFYVSSGTARPDASFGVNAVQPGIDAGFQVKVCKGVSVPDLATPGGK